MSRTTSKRISITDGKSRGRKNEREEKRKKTNTKYRSRKYKEGADEEK